MSLLSVAQAEGILNVASNLDTAATEFVRATGSTAVNQAFGTLTQSSDSLTGNASYIFGSNARVQYSQLGNNGGVNNFTQEFVFKKTSKPTGTGNVHVLASMPNSATNNVNFIGIDTSGYLQVYIRGFYTSLNATYSTDLCDDKWHHVAVAYLDTTNGYRVYVDGTLVGSGSTLGNSSWYGIWNLGSYLDTNLTTVHSYFDGKIDFAAFYNGSISTTGMDNFVANHRAEFANKVLTATALTASGLAVQPAITTIRSANYSATPATASATFPNAIQSARNNFTLLNTYLGTLSLEQWYKFDDVKNIINYGSGGGAAFYFTGNATSEDHSGIQGSGALRICGNDSDGGVLITLDDYTTMAPELTDGDFSVGFWVKAPSAVEANGAVIWNAVNYNDGKYSSFLMHNSGKLDFQMYTNNMHSVQTATSICDNQWHLIVGKFNGTTMSLYVDNTLIGTQTVTQYSAPNFVSFGSNNQAANGNFFSVSNFFISSSSAITTTVMGNMITYSGGAALQGYANMETPKLSFNNAFNNLTETRGALVDLRFNEASGSPENYGTTTGINLTTTGDAITYGQLSRNTKAYKLTSSNAKISSVVDYPAGTFTTNNDQTLMLYAKVDTGTEPPVQSILAVAGHFGGPYGTGLGLLMLGSGAIRARLRGGAGFDTITSSGSYADSQYHLYTATTDGSTFKLYIDGKLEGSVSTSITLTDSGLLMIGGEGDTFGFWDQSKSTYIDELSVYNSAFTAAQVFDHFQSLSQDMGWTATALMVQPTASLGYGPIINPGVGYATALLADPTQQDTINNLAIPLTATGLLQNPNYAATKNFNYSATPMTATAEEEDSGASAGGITTAGHMDASAYMPDAKAVVPGRWNASPFIANANAVQPGLVTTLGALIKPQSLNATAFFSLPPAYYLVADDKWYQRLLDVDYQSPKYGGIITFFNTSSNIYLNGGYEDWTAHSNRNPLNANYGYNLYDTPLPVAEAGHFDPLNRKALRLKNIALEAGDNETYSDGWTMEAMIQTTKKNQFIAAGRYLGNPASSVSRSYRTGIRLKDGKIAFTNVKDSTLGFFKSTDSIAFTGFKDIADGEWHHIIIQYRPTGTDQYAPRTQVFIDGKLDVQRYGGIAYYPGQIGYNSNDVDVYSDFKISAISVNKESFVLQRETYINYLAAFGISPIEAPAATASVELTNGTRGKGNRARALMLYFWPTFNADSGYYVGDYYNPFKPVGVNTSSGHDVGNEPYDYDTFYGLTTYLTDKTQTFFDWDVFPLPVMNFYSGDTYRGDSHPLLNKDVTIASGTTRGTTYVDPVTNNYRYVNLMKDVYELDQYDAIFFRNYPDQSKEQDAIGLNSKTEVDEYFNLQEKTLFAEFLDNLREAVDTYNLSLFVTNPQLAKDLGIIANASDIPLLRDQGSFYEGEHSDNRAPVVTGRVNLDGTPKDPVNEAGAEWIDTWFNDRHRVINTLEYLTDDNTFIWTDYAFYQNDDQFEYGGPDRLYKRYENRPYGLQIDDEFVFADSGNPKFRLPYQAVKPSDILAGIPITALSKKIWNQNYGSYVQVDNPYKDYVTTIALPVGTNLKGKLTGGKIFVSFSENVGNSVTYASPQFNTNFVEYHEYDMASNYWVDIAFNAGIIDAATRAQYKAGTTGVQPPLYDDNDGIKQYWSLSGDNIISRVEPITQNLKGFVGGDVANLLIQNPTKTRTRTGLNGLSNSTRLRDALGRFASGGGASSVTGGNLVTFKIVMGRVYDTGTIFTPSINTRGLWWISDKVRLTGKVVGAPAMVTNAILPQPVVTADHPTTILVTAMIATATINETQKKGPDRAVGVLPMYASATIVGLGGKNILAGTGANATAAIVSAYPVTQGPEQIIMYLHHVDPILYLRKEIIR